MDAQWPEVDIEEGLEIMPFDEATLRAHGAAVLGELFASEGRSLRLSVHFCGDPAMRALHEKWLGDDSPTDVMSFPMGETLPGAAEGELVVCLDYARSQARAYDNPFENEVALYLVHGALHLLGYDDHDAQELTKMKRSEARVLRRLRLDVKGRHAVD